MTLAFVNPHRRTPRPQNEDSRQRMKRIAAAAAQKARETGASYNIIVPFEVEGDPYTRHAPSGLDSEPAMAMIHESLKRNDCTVLVGSPIEITRVLTHLKVTYIDPIDHSIPVYSATLTSLRNAA